MVTARRRFSGGRHKSREPTQNARVKKDVMVSGRARIGKTRVIQGATQRVFLIGTRSANSIKASGQMYRVSGFYI